MGRCIDKAGGLDNYILQTPPSKLHSDVGEKLRSDIQDSQQASRPHL